MNRGAAAAGDVAIYVEMGCGDAAAATPRRRRGTSVETGARLRYAVPGARPGELPGALQLLRAARGAPGLRVAREPGAAFAYGDLGFLALLLRGYVSDESRRRRDVNIRGDESRRRGGGDVDSPRRRVAARPRPRRG